jgi:DMSO/TMAO reductase YedYZ molybdopterin-dependent catalytic subunit
MLDAMSRVRRRPLVAAGLLAGCAGDDDAPLVPTDGELLGRLPFDENVSAPLDTKVGQGWDARLYRDLSDLGPETLVTPNELFYIRTEHPDLLDESAPWLVRLGGLVAAEVDLEIDDLYAIEEPQGVHLLECSGNSDGGAFGLLSAAEWAGAPMSAVLELADLDASATRVLVSGFDEHSVPSNNGHSTPGASWIFTFADLERAFLATRMNGELLPKDHGFPVRLFVPGWYGCTCIKWVNEILLVDEDAPATSQMQEFASRTHQDGTPALARDYIPAVIDQTAMPVRVEKWLVDGTIAYRVVGILWGGAQLTDALTISFDGGQSHQPVAVSPPMTTNATWTSWSHTWRPESTGRHVIRMGIADPTIRTRRLDSGWYDRAVIVDEI